MCDAKSKVIRDEGLAFMGKITAGQSHEVTNVLNIIGELAGLQQDVLLSAHRGKQVNLAKLEETSHKIQSQVARGEMIIRNINQFAHSVGAPIAVFDVNEAIRRIVFLAKRWTRLKKIELTAELPDKTTAIENNPLLFQQAIFACIDAASMTAAAKRKVSVGCVVKGSCVETVVTSDDPVSMIPEVEMKVVSLRALVGELGGEVRALPGEGDPGRFIFSVSSRPHRSSESNSAAATED